MLPALHYGWRLCQHRYSRTCLWFAARPRCGRAKRGTELEAAAHQTQMTNALLEPDAGASRPFAPIQPSTRKGRNAPQAGEGMLARLLSSTKTPDMRRSSKPSPASGGGLGGGEASGAVTSDAGEEHCASRTSTRSNRSPQPRPGRAHPMRDDCASLAREPVTRPRRIAATTCSTPQRTSSRKAGSKVCGSPSLSAGVTPSRRASIGYRSTLSKPSSVTPLRNDGPCAMNIARISGAAGS